MKFTFHSRDSRKCIQRWGPATREDTRLRASSKNRVISKRYVRGGAAEVYPPGDAGNEGGKAVWSRNSAWIYASFRKYTPVPHPTPQTPLSFPCRDTQRVRFNEIDLTRKRSVSLASRGARLQDGNFATRTKPGSKKFPRASIRFQLRRRVTTSRTRRRPSTSAVALYVGSREKCYAPNFHETLSAHSEMKNVSPGISLFLYTGEAFFYTGTCQYCETYGYLECWQFQI